MSEAIESIAIVFDRLDNGYQFAYIVVTSKELTSDEYEGIIRAKAMRDADLTMDATIIMQNMPAASPSIKD